MSERLTPERLAKIRAWIGWSLSTPNAIYSDECLREVLAELDAVTREREDALAALTTIAFATECLDTSPDEIAKHVIGFAGAYGLEREHNESDSRRIDFLQAIMTPKDGYVEVYLAGLRRGHADADMYQVEFQPLTQRVVTGPTLREAIDAALTAALGGAA